MHTKSPIAVQAAQVGKAGQSRDVARIVSAYGHRVPRGLTLSFRWFGYLLSRADRQVIAGVSGRIKRGVFGGCSVVTWGASHGA